ncbi:MAG: endopeptidase La, partial [Clostridia bacterium]|nr:endopeptidase La [Clostridia bacterium]
MVFPGEMVHFDIGRPKSAAALREAMEDDQLLFLVMQRDPMTEDPLPEDLYPMGTVARVRQVLKLPGDGLRVAVEGLYRAIVSKFEQIDPFYLVQTTERLSREPADEAAEIALLRDLRYGFVEYAKISPSLSADAMTRMNHISRLADVSDHIIATLPLTAEEKQGALSQLSVLRRSEKALVYLQREQKIARVELDIQQKVQERVDENQRDYYLREQMRVIADELGEEDNPLEESEEYRAKVRALALPEEIEGKLLKECDKLSKMPLGSHEATVVRGYLDACLELPWNNKTTDTFDLKEARRILDRDHYGLTEVKERILEILAVRHLAPEVKGQVICLLGPPGVGKTSIAKSMATAMGRRYVRVSLGGVRDEAEIRGHRRTYVGAMMGRIMSAISQSGVSNPLLLLDEVDKMSCDFRGDPASAMLEVLDTEQNYRFVDHFVDLPFDLSDVLFVTTANDADGIPQPLYDRMDVIRIGGYTEAEKVHIAREHLVKKALKANGLTARQVRFTEKTLHAIIHGYTREAGVRTLERTIGKICRKAARRVVEEGVQSVSLTNLEALLGPRKFKDDRLPTEHEVGLVNGLAWTSTGGELLPIEVAVLEGTGKIELTGSLGDVMKESARIGVSYVRAHADEWNIDRDFYKTKDIHIHAPEGAIPKEGPSAGIAMTTALISALTGIPVRRDVAMTGEISLRG